MCVSILLNSLSLIRHSYCISSVFSKQAYVDKITYLQILTFKYSSLREHSASLDLVFLGRPFRAEISPGFLTQRITVSQGLLPLRASCHAFQLGRPAGWLLGSSVWGVCCGGEGRDQLCLKLLLLLRCKSLREVRYHVCVSGYVCCTACEKQTQTRASVIQKASEINDPMEGR